MCVRERERERERERARDRERETVCNVYVLHMLHQHMATHTPL